MANQFSPEHLRIFENGECIFQEGENSREMYVIQSGAVQIKKFKADGSMFDLIRFERGDFFGEMSLLESLPRTASAFAIGKTKLLTIQPGGFLLRIRRDPTFAFEIIQALSGRIRVTNELAVLALEEGKSDQMQRILEKNSA